MTTLTIKAADIEVDDQLYMGEKFANNPNHRWVNVKRIRRNQSMIMVSTEHSEHWFSPDDDVLVQRFGDLNADDTEEEIFP